MRIASKEKTPGRVHEAAGKQYTFMPEDGTTDPMIAVVTDPAAQAVFLHERNANTFYAADPVLGKLSRPGAPPAGEMNAETTEAVALLAGNNAANSIAAIEKMTGVDFDALTTAEAGNKNRRTVLAAIKDRIDAAAGGVTQDVTDQATLVLTNDVETVLSLVATITDTALLSEARRQEAIGEKREPVMAALNAKLG